MIPGWRILCDLTLKILHPKFQGNILAYDDITLVLSDHNDWENCKRRLDGRALTKPHPGMLDVFPIQLVGAYSKGHFCCTLNAYLYYESVSKVK